MRLEQRGPLPPEAWAALVADEEDPFGVGDDPTEWRRKEHYTVLYDSDRPIAAAGLTVAVVEIAEHSLEVVGVGGVIVTRSHRGQGHLRTVLEAALARAATLGPDVAMLFCSAANVALYAHFGFSELTAPVTVDQPGGPTLMPPHAMWRRLKGDSPLEGGGPVRLRGLPF
jgi:predicted GNAT family N-acyltransferase